MNSPENITPQESISVVLIESVLSTREVYLSALSQLDMVNVHAFASGNEFLLAMQNGNLHCDVLIVDINDTSPHGYVLIQKVRANTQYDHIDVLATSRIITDDDLVLFNEYGVFSWYQKQSEVGNLVEKVIELALHRRAELPLVKKLRKLETAIRQEKSDIIDELVRPVDVNEAIKGDPRFLYLYGEFLILNKQYEDAVQFLNNALIYHIGHKSIEQFKNLNTLAKALCLAGRFSEAEAVYKRLEEKSPKNLSVKVSLAETQLSQGNSTAARAHFEDVTQADPTHKDAHIGLAKVELFDGDLQKAEGHLQQIDGPIESYSLASFFNNRAVTFVRLGRVDDAIELYKTALKYLGKYQGLIYFNLGLAYSRIGRSEEAELCYNNAVKNGGEQLAAKKMTLQKTKKSSEEQFISKQVAS